MEGGIDFNAGYQYRMKSHGEVIFVHLEIAGLPLTVHPIFIGELQWSVIYCLRIQ